jgi:hypothetical protein
MVWPYAILQYRNRLLIQRFYHDINTSLSQAASKEYPHGKHHPSIRKFLRAHTIIVSGFTIMERLEKSAFDIRKAIQAAEDICCYPAWPSGLRPQLRWSFIRKRGSIHGY